MDKTTEKLIFQRIMPAVFWLLGVDNCAVVISWSLCLLIDFFL